MRRVAAAVVVVVGIVSACGDQPASSDTTLEQASSLAVTIPTSTTPPSTTTEIAATTLSPIVVPSSTQVTADSIVSDLGVVSFVLPADVGPDPMPMSALPDFVVGYGKWFVECCYLKIALQNLDPPIPGQEGIADFESNGMTWAAYDTGPRDGTIIMAKATKGAITGPGQRTGEISGWGSRRSRTNRR